MCLVLASCGSIAEDSAAGRAQTEMIGMSKAQVLACMGPAERTAAEGTLEVWQYNVGEVTGFRGNVAQSACQVDVQWGAGKVASVSYRTQNARLLAPNALCGQAVARCLR
jgi:hypothetical protein